MDADNIATPLAGPSSMQDSQVGIVGVDKKDVVTAGITDSRVPTSRSEYWTYCFFCFSTLGTGVGVDGGALRQALISLAYPDGIVHWGGKRLTLNSMLLDLNGVLLLLQMLVMLLLGSYADYGKWRFWVLLGADAILILSMLEMSTLTQTSNWRAAQIIFMVGSLANNVLGSFYSASFAELARNLPHMLESEKQVRLAQKSPGEHAALDMYERAKLYNLVNTTGSVTVAVFAAGALIITSVIGIETNTRLIECYRVLLSYFAIATLSTSLPFLICSKQRPGLPFPPKAKWWTLGPKQVYRAGRQVRRLRHCLLYLLAYFCLCEASGTYGGIVGILQNEVIHYSPIRLNEFSLLGNLCGGLGTFACLVLQRRWRFSIKQGALYGAIMVIIPCVWGMIGCFTNWVGFHNSWEFWLVAAWNVQTAAWGSYNIAMISEVVPASKMFMFFALFNTVGKTSGFVGPLLASVTIDWAGGNTNAAFWLLTAMGVLGVTILWHVDTDQAKIDGETFEQMEISEELDATETTALLREEHS